MNKPDENNQQTDESLPLLTHLVELRQRLLRCIIALVVVCGGLMYFSTDIYTLFMQPMMKSLSSQRGFLASGTLSPFVTPFKFTFYLSLFICMPYLLHQIWGFVSPGLYQKEKRFALPLLISSVLLFYIGIIFAYFFVIPILFHFIASITIPGVTYMPDIGSSLDFILNLFLGFGIAFEVPVITLLMMLAGITTPQSLADKRTYVFVGCFIIGAILTPPDIISQTMMAVPMWLLFELSILVGKLLTKNNDQETNLN